MKLHVGRTELPGTLTFVSDGYWFKEDNEPAVFRRYAEPQPITRAVLAMWGVSLWGTFVGVMKCSKPAKR